MSSLQIQRTRTKVCGFTRVQDMLAAAGSGVDAVGLVFYADSPRHVSLERAREIARRVPVFVDVVALFVDPEPALVESVVDQLQPELLQFHGAESAAFCAQFQRPYIKALRMSGDFSLEQQAEVYDNARGLLLDSYQPGVPGGTGKTFDWDLIPVSLRNRIVLAGGLDPGNVARAVSQVAPWGVDVSGGVERSPGIKDPELIRQFVEQVQAGTGARER